MDSETYYNIPHNYNIPSISLLLFITLYSPLIVSSSLFLPFPSSSLYTDSQLYSFIHSHSHSHLGFDVDLTLNFLFKQSHTDVTVLKDIKTATEGRSNVLHNATVVAHAYMNAGN